MFCNGLMVNFDLSCAFKGSKLMLCKPVFLKLDILYQLSFISLFFSPSPFFYLLFHFPVFFLPPSFSQVLHCLETLPLQCLCPSDKIQVLAFLVDELLNSGTLTKEVDVRMEQVATLRREKWKISLKLKR